MMQSNIHHSNGNQWAQEVAPCFNKSVQIELNISTPGSWISPNAAVSFIEFNNERYISLTRTGGLMNCLYKFNDDGGVIFYDFNTKSRAEFSYKEIIDAEFTNQASYTLGMFYYYALIHVLPEENLARKYFVDQVNKSCFSGGLILGNGDHSTTNYIINGKVAHVAKSVEFNFNRDLIHDFKKNEKRSTVYNLDAILKQIRKLQKANSSSREEANEINFTISASNCDCIVSWSAIGGLSLMNYGEGLFRDVNQIIFDDNIAYAVVAEPGKGADQIYFWGINDMWIVTVSIPYAASNQQEKEIIKIFIELIRKAKTDLNQSDIHNGLNQSDLHK